MIGMSAAQGNIVISAVFPCLAVLTAFNTNKTILVTCIVIQAAFVLCFRTEKLRIYFLQLGKQQLVSIAPPGCTYGWVINIANVPPLFIMSYELILTTQKFLSENAPSSELSNIQRKERNFQDLADWYAELSYTWLRIRHYAQEQDAVKVYMWGIMLQEEPNNVCADFGLEKMELMAAYDPDNLSAFAGCSDKYESEMRTIIEDGGGTIREFKDFEEFLDEI